MRLASRSVIGYWAPNQDFKEKDCLIPQKKTPDMVEFVRFIDPGA
jgi:argininosuccinate lyase